MNTSDEEDLILHRYGELDAAASRALAARLDRDPQLKREQARLNALLDALGELPAPAPEAGFEKDLWKRLEPQLETGPAQVHSLPKRRVPPRWQPLALAAGLVAAVGLAFVAGRMSQETGQPLASLPAGEPVAPTVAAQSEGFPAQARARLLRASLSDHLDRSQRLMRDVVNSTPAEDDALFGAAEQAWAGELLVWNRMYRNAALEAGQIRIAALLSDLEPLLLDLANTGTPEGTAERAGIRKRIDAQDLIFRMHVTQSGMQRAPAANAAGERT